MPPTPPGGRSFWSLGRKISAGLALALVVCFALLIAVQSIQMRASLLEAATADARDTGRLLAVAARGGIAAGDALEVESNFAPLVADPASALAAYRGTRANGQEVVAYQAEGLPAFDAAAFLQAHPEVAEGRPAIAQTDGHIAVAVPVTNPRGTKVTGALTIAWSTTALDAAVRRAVLVNSALACGALVLLFVATLALVRWMASRPLQGIAGCMQAIAAGQL
ncbi:MAG TPA: hypothetical protein VEH84_11435, partial [Alphaproteobacteria bacterium]|nr:hypothetical protein [Alphaproteobacteria bacterium]